MNRFEVDFHIFGIDVTMSRQKLGTILKEYASKIEISRNISTKSCGPNALNSNIIFQEY